MIERNYHLSAHNTFGLPSVAERYLRLDHLDQLQALELDHPPDLLLGGGSNLLLLDEVPGLTLHVNLRGIDHVHADGRTTPVDNSYRHSGPPAVIRAAAGVNWQQFVLFTLAKNLHGLENLALIPGTVGACPVQNIGAYGVEVSSRILAVHVYEYGKGPRVLSNEDCNFSYRNSLFKQEEGKYLITAVDFVLGGEFEPALSYGALADRLALRFPGVPASPLRIARCVMEIRSEKLPFFSQLGNAGSFFKNPVVDEATFKRLKARYPELPAYRAAGSDSKLAAGWLIDQAGWRGKREGQVGCYRHQALVIVNYGGASGTEVLNFSERIREDVNDKFGIELEREVRLTGQQSKPT